MGKSGDIGIAESSIIITDIKEEDVDIVVWPIIDLLLISGLCVSRSEAKRKVKEGGVYINGTRILNIEASVPIEFNLRMGKSTVNVISAIKREDNTPVVLLIPNGISCRSKNGAIA